MTCAMDMCVRLNVCDFGVTKIAVCRIRIKHMIEIAQNS